MSNATGPIADLSYRSYEGTLDAPTQRWKVIAAYSGEGLSHVKTIWRNGWVTIHFTQGKG